MKKQHIITITLIILIAASIYGLKLLSKYQSKSYVFAVELQKQGLAITDIKFESSTNIIDVVTATGDSLKVKVTHYGNALFIKNVVANLEKDKKENTKIEPQPIYVAGNLIIALYQEPVPGQVKAAIGRIYSGIREY